jgi:hypothetical protein
MRKKDDKLWPDKTHKLFCIYGNILQFAHAVQTEELKHAIKDVEKKLAAAITTELENY